MKRTGEYGHRHGSAAETTQHLIERLIHDGTLQIDSSAAQTTLADLVAQGDELSQRAVALIQGLAEVCARHESDLSEWRDIQAGCISDTTDRGTKTRIIVAKLLRLDPVM